jgi:hypothetical protein
VAAQFFEGFKLDTLIGAVAIVLGAIGIYIAVRERAAVEDARETLGETMVLLEETRTALSAAVADVRSQITTHYIGHFPAFLPEIATSLAQAKKSIKIFCDQPAYGVVSAPESYAAYVELLKQKHAEGVTIEMVHLNKPRREESHRVQFCGPRWKATLASPVLDSFVENHPDDAGGKPLAELSEDEFLAFLERLQRRALDKDFTFNKSHRYATSQIMPLYFWIPDTGPAVFALTRFDSDRHEEGFRTESRALIASMSSIFVRYRTVVRGDPIAPPPTVTAQIPRARPATPGGDAKS